MNHRPKGTTQAQIANNSGLKQCQVSKIESGQLGTVRNYEKYLKACGKKLTVIKIYKGR